MEIWIPWFLLGVAAYCAGCIPTGYLLGRWRGIDIREHGSGNIGATNVFRCLGKKLGILTLVVDAMKGLLPVLAVRWVFRPWFGEALHEALMLGAAMAVLGHVWPVTMRFRGGKGVATAAGGLLGVVPAAMGAALAVWIIVFLVSGYVSLASITAAVTVAATAWIVVGQETRVIPIAISLLAAITVWRHRGNMIRLLQGTESGFRRFGRGAKPKGEQGDHGSCVKR